MTTELNPVDKWKSIPWRKLRKIVFRLQVRIFGSSLPSMLIAAY